MWDYKLRQEFGRRMHQGIARAVIGDLSPAAVLRLAAELVPADGLTRPVASHLRDELASKIEAYMARARPRSPWQLVGVEEGLYHSRLDLLWWHPALLALVIDELKSGRADRTSPSAYGQVRRLVLDGATRWGERFAGVRVVPMELLSQAWMTAPHWDSRGRLDVRPALLPAGMEVR